MKRILTWAGVLLIVIIAVSPVFEIFDKTDALAQDTTDLVRYVLCFLVFLAISLPRTIVSLRAMAPRHPIAGLLRCVKLDGRLIATIIPRSSDRALFLALHDLRI